MVDLNILRKEIPEVCSRYGIAYVDVFGSVARNEQVEDSDLDLIIELEEPRRTRMTQRFFGFLHTLEDRYQLKVDLLTEKSLTNPYLIRNINKERIRIYG
jgi:predicted nucleotidyltransferase